MMKPSGLHHDATLLSGMDCDLGSGLPSGLLRDRRLLKCDPSGAANQLTVSPSYSLTVLQSLGLLVSQSLGLSVSWSFFSFGSRPAFRSASLIIHSNCPFVLRNSSAAHFSRASNFSGFNRSTKDFLGFITD